LVSPNTRKDFTIDPVGIRDYCINIFRCIDVRI
jgi:hypothetical protein